MLKAGTNYDKYKSVSEEDISVEGKRGVSVCEKKYTSITPIS